MKTISINIDPTTPEGRQLGWSIVNQLLAQLEVVGHFWERGHADVYAEKPLTDEEWKKVFNTEHWQSLRFPDDPDYAPILDAFQEVGIKADEGVVY